MPRAQIKTGQYVSIAQTPASVGERIVAQFIDLFIMMIYEISVLVSIMYLNENSPLFSSNLYITLIVLVGVLPVTFYHPVCEKVMHGQSVGKRIMKLQVAMLDGSSPTLGAYVTRWAFYPLDVILTSGLGVVFILFTRNNQRMGDLAAGTVVIKKQNYTRDSFLFNDAPYIAPGYVPTYPEAADLTLNQVDLISRTFYTNSPDRDELVERLALKIEQHLGIERMGMSAADFITVVSNDYHYYASTLDL